MQPFLFFLAAALLLLIALVVIDRRKHPGAPLAQVIRTWPWTDTFLAGAVLLSIWTVLFYQGCLVAFRTESFDAFKGAMEPVFDFLNIMLGSAGLTVIGRRATTKADVITAEAQRGTGAG